MLPHHFSRWVLALMIALVAVGMSFDRAAAAPAGGAHRPRVNARLAQMYRVEQLRLRVQGERLTRVDLFAGKLDTLIAKLKAKGQNTAALDQALAAFRAAIEQARTEWNAAKSTLGSHAGFGTDGKVTDADQARATLEDAHAHMQQAHALAKGAFRDLRAAFIAYRKAHRNVPEVPAPLEP
jgi:multidrug resistance efflux pump